MPATPILWCISIGLFKLRSGRNTSKFFYFTGNLQPQELRCFFKWVSYSS